MHLSHPHVEIIAKNLGFPEGPLVLDDRSILVCDVHGGRIRRVTGSKVEVFADLGGAPNGIALGHDGWLYIANAGGSMRWRQDGDLLISEGYLQDGYDARIERIHVQTRQIERVADKVDQKRFEALDDVICDPRGGMWLTGIGRGAKRSRTYGGIYWASEDGRDVREVAYPLVGGANGIGLSPDGKTLYATEYHAGRLWAWTIEGRGHLRMEPGQRHGGRLIWQAPDAQLLDSLKVSATGNIIIATQTGGVFSVISPTGELRATLVMPEHFPTNLCFDPADPTAAYVTLSNTGRLGRLRWPEAGLAPGPGGAFPYFPSA